MNAITERPVEALVGRPIYGLSAKGKSLNGWQFKMRSRRLYDRPEDATAAIAEFTNACCDETQFECAERGTLIVEVCEYELLSPNNKLTGSRSESGSAES